MQTNPAARDACAQRAPRRLQGDRGTVVIEGVLVMPLFFLLIFGVIDYSGVFRDYESLTYLVQTGGRVAAVEVNRTDADYLVVSRIAAESFGLRQNSIRRIVVWRATDDGSGLAWRKGASSVVPPACRAADVGNATNLCNVFSRTAGTVAPTAIDRAVWSDCLDQSNPARFWCSTVRKSAVQGPAGPPDLVGLYVEVVHAFVTGAFGTSTVMTEQGVFVLETTRNQ